MHVIVACRARLATIPPLANHLEIYTRRANFPASRTLALATQPRRRLDETSCKNQAEGYRHHFHFTVVLQELSLNAGGLSQYSQLFRNLNVFGGAHESLLRLTRFMGGLI